MCRAAWEWIFGFLCFNGHGLAVVVNKVCGLSSVRVSALLAAQQPLRSWLAGLEYASECPKALACLAFETGASCWWQVRKCWWCGLCASSRTWTEFLEGRPFAIYGGAHGLCHQQGVEVLWQLHCSSDVECGPASSRPNLNATTNGNVEYPVSKISLGLGRGGG